MNKLNKLSKLEEHNGHHDDVPVNPEIEMFGETIESMRGAVIFSNLNDPYDLTFYAMSILSDVQMVLLNGDTEKARQWVNKAKYFLSEANKINRK